MPKAKSKLKKAAAPRKSQQTPKKKVPAEEMTPDVNALGKTSKGAKKPPPKKAPPRRYKQKN